MSLYIKQNALLLCCFSLVLSCASVDKYNATITQLHPVANLHNDIDKLYTKLQRLHPHLYQYTPKPQLDFKFDSLKKAINSPLTSRQFYKQISQVTKYVGQGHFAVIPPLKRYNRKARKALNKTTFGINQLETEFIDGKLIISNVKKKRFETKTNKDSVLIHSEILKINNQTPQQLIATFKNRIASDGFNTTFYNRAIGKRFFRLYRYNVGRFDSIALTLRNPDSTYVKQYKRMPKPKVKTDSITKDSISKDSLSTKKPKLTKAERKANKAKRKKEWKENSERGYNYFSNNYTRTLNFVGKDSTVALLSIKEFSWGNYKPFYNKTFKTLDSLKTKHLVIDLRNNFGGRLAEISNLYTYLTHKPHQFIRKSETNTRIPVLKSMFSNSRSLGIKVVGGLFSPYLLVKDLIKSSKTNGQKHYSFKSEKEQQPSPFHFKGKIYVLINGNSFSASSILSAKLKDDNRAIFIGEETGGAANGTVAGISKTYILPHTKLKAHFGMIHIGTSYQQQPDGYGITPDVSVLPTYADKINGTDPELDWVLNHISGHKNL